MEQNLITEKEKVPEIITGNPGEKKINNKAIRDKIWGICMCVCIRQR